MRLSRLLGGVLLLLGLATAAADDLRNLADKVVTGDIVSIDDKNVVIKTAAGPMSVPVQTDVIELSFNPAPALSSMPYCHQVELTDGSLVHVKPEGGFVIKDSKVTLTLLNDSKFEVPLTALSYVLKNANDAKIRDNPDWKKSLKARATRDMVVAWDKNKERLNNPEGTFAEKGVGTVLPFTIASTGTTIEENDLAKARTQGWIFVNKPDAGAPVAVCRLIDVNHNNFAVAKVALKEGGNLEATTVFGVKLELPKAQVASLDFRKGRLEFISEIEPKIVDQPSEDREDRYRWYGRGLEDKRNKNLDGHKLRLGDKDFGRGLSLPAPTTLQYSLGGEFKEFSAVIGVDETVAGGSHAKLIIEGDGRELVKPIEVKRKDAPKEIRVNVKDVNTLTIKVVPAGVLPYGHRIDLGDPKVNK